MVYIRVHSQNKEPGCIFNKDFGDYLFWKILDIKNILFINCKKSNENPYK